MTDHTELKLAADAASQGRWNQDGFDVQNDDINDYRVARCNRLADAKFIAAANPAAVLALIAENEQLAKTADCWDRLNVQNKALSDSFRLERDQLKAENDALKGPHDWLAEDLIKELVDNAQAIQENADDGEEDSFVIVLLASASRIRRQEANIDQLRAEVAGLKTGYEAYERVNAELKAEVEVFRGLLGEMRAIGNHAPAELTLRIDAAMGKGERP